MTRPATPSPAEAARETATASRPSADTGGRIPGLDGLRALAVAMVVVFHFAPGALVGGFLGVDIFFVVSGFLITHLLLRERVRTGRIRLGAFWLRRARRLLPALVVLLLACSTAALVVGGDVLVGIGGQLLAALTFTSNWYFIATGSDYFAHTAPELFRNLWSLGVEEQFYLLWPLVVILVLVRLPRSGRIALLALLTLASAGAMALLLDPGDPTRVYYGTGTHAFGLTMGALVAVAAQWWSTRELEWSRPLRRLTGASGWIALAGLLTLALVMPGEAEASYRGGLLLVAGLTAVVVVAARTPGSSLARALEAPPLRWIGERSYGIYLWHWPVIVLLAAAFPSTDPWVTVAVVAAATVITLGASALSYRFVEQPIRRDGFRRALRPRSSGQEGARSRVLAAGLAVLLFATGAAGTAAAVALAPAASETEQRIEAGREAIETDPNGTPVPTPSETPGESPSPSQTPAAPAGENVTAIGDSVMLAAVPELQAALPGIAIDAAVSRQLSAAPAILTALRDAGALRETVVIGLGTNGSISSGTLAEILQIIGPDRQLVVITAQAPRGWIPEVNERLAAFAWQYRDVELADWHAAAQPIMHELARDQVHFGHIGATRYAEVVQAALTRLAELPPLRDDVADESLPRPV